MNNKSIILFDCRCLKYDLVVFDRSSVCRLAIEKCLSVCKPTGVYLLWNILK